MPSFLGEFRFFFGGVEKTGKRTVSGTQLTEGKAVALIQEKVSLQYTGNKNSADKVRVFQIGRIPCP